MSKPKAVVLVNAGLDTEVTYHRGKGWVIEDGDLLILDKNRRTIAVHRTWSSVCESR